MSETMTLSERLRAATCAGAVYPLMCEAADEIDRLFAEQQGMADWCQIGRDAQSTIDSLRGVQTTILKWCEANIEDGTQVTDFCVQVRDLIERGNTSNFQKAEVSGTLRDAEIAQLIEENAEYQRENAALREAKKLDAAELRRLRKALDEIADSKFCIYDNNGPGQYGIGVTDGHRYCAGIAKRALAQSNDTPDAEGGATGESHD